MDHQEFTGKLRSGAGRGSLHRLVRRLALQSESSVLPLIFGKSRHNIVASEGNTVVENLLSDFQCFRHARRLLEYGSVSLFFRPLLQGDGSQ
jgi:hypothetical protein